jgi:hypothetical protein
MARSVLRTLSGGHPDMAALLPVSVAVLGLMRGDDQFDYW